MQYCADGLFHWVTYRFKPVKASFAAERNFSEQAHDERCKHAVGLFSKLGELGGDRVRIFNL